MNARQLARKAELILNRIEAENRVMTREEEAEYERLVSAAETVKALEADEPRPTFRGQPQYDIPTDPVRHSDVGNIITFPGAKLHAFSNNRDGREKAYRAGRFFAAALLNHSPSLAWTRENGIHVDIMAALSTGVNTNGGALVPSELSATIMELMEVYGAFRANADNLPMSSDTLTVPRRVGGLAAFYTGENTEGTESDASWDNVQFVAKKLMVLTRMSSEISEDAIISLGDKLTQEISIAMATKEDEVGFNSDGTSTYGGHTGVLVKAIDADHTKAKVAAASGHDTLAEIDSADLINLMAAIPKYAKAGSKWYCSPEALALVFNAIQIAATGNNMQNLANAPSPSFLGYPIVTTPVMADDASATYNALPMIGIW
jgi:HK97 family phage major capsid protein